MTVPINVPEEYFAATGLRSEADLAWPTTPTEMTVDEMVWGDADATAVVADLGCYREGATASLTPGSTLLVLAERVDPWFGPFALFGGTHRYIDWYEVDQTHHLTPRVGFLGCRHSHIPRRDGATRRDRPSHASAVAER
jgi:hypothetical protein